MGTHTRTDCERYHRRDALRLGAAGLLGVGLADLLRLEARSAARARPGGRARGVILVWLSGGPATIDMWDLKPEAPEEVRGAFRPIATAVPGLQVCEHLPKLARVLDHCTIVRSLHHAIAAHGPGTAYMTTGNRPSPALEYPTLGALAAQARPAPPGVPAHVTFRALGNGYPGGAGYLGPAFRPFEIEGDPAAGPLRAQGASLPDGFPVAELEDRDRLFRRLDAGLRAVDRSGLVDGLDDFHRQALDILRSDRVRRALDLAREPSPLRDAYGRTPLGQGALAARRLIEAGARFVALSYGGWDTHAGNFNALRGRLLPTLDRSLAALIDDLRDRGLLDETVVYCAGEFGRTPRVNASAGRDHWSRSMAVLLAGGGFRPGLVHGGTDRLGSAPATDPCSPDDVSATVLAALGIDPRHEFQTAAGRPIAAFREGRLIEPLLDS